LRHTGDHEAGGEHGHLHTVGKIREVEIEAGERRWRRGIRVGVGVGVGVGVVARGQAIVVVGESWTVARTI
jgi:hypothetical protein